jgi:23S rRNA pseudouridine1911/1915/1917 synthase
VTKRIVSIIVAEHQAGWRLDRVLLSAEPELGRRRTKKLFGDGAVTCSGRRARGGDPARAGDELRAELEDDLAIPEPEAALDVRLELPELVVVNKPAGQPSAPLGPGEVGTLANALVARYPEMAGVGYRPREPGLVHRLDTQTSGLLVAARSSVQFKLLRDALTGGRLEKRYFAIVSDHGLPEEGVIDHALALDPRAPERVLLAEHASEDAYRRPATTRYRVLERARGRLLLEVDAPQAMRHQIRAHLASVEHPIVGDHVYGGEAAPELGARHALHASYVACKGERAARSSKEEGTLPSFAVRAELPAELRALLLPAP